MAEFVVIVVAVFAAGLTLFSGFGLGTLLLPAFALVFPADVAVGATAVVHLANNVFKLVLVGRDAEVRVVLRFGVPAIAGAMLGAALLVALGTGSVVIAWEAGPISAGITPLGLVLGGLILLFAIAEFHPAAKRVEFSRRRLPIGGVLSGFFGGLSGHQGALRSAFLVRAGLDRDRFVGTAAVCSVLVDCTRLLVYAAGLGVFAGAFAALTPAQWRLVAAASVAAFAGSFLGSRLVKKVTIDWIRTLVGSLLLVVGLLMIAGLVGSATFGEGLDPGDAG